MAVVGVVGTHFGILVALVDTGYARQRQVDDLQQHRASVAFLRVSDTYVAGPAGLLASVVVLVKAHSFAGERGKAYLVVVAGDITHGVVASVGGERGQHGLSHFLQVTFLAERLAQGEIDVEVKLGIQHTGLHVGIDQFGRTVCLADHPQCAVGVAGRDFLTQHTPVALGYMLAGIVAIAVEVVLLQPVQRRVGHWFAHLRTL